MAEAHDALICVGEKTFVDDKNRKKFQKNHIPKQKICRSSRYKLKTIQKQEKQKLQRNYIFLIQEKKAI